MVRPRRLIVAYLLGSLLLLPASLHPPTAYAAPGDPPSGSPAGSVYQLPLEQGRSDAAPKGSGGTGAGGGGSGGGSSTNSAAEPGEAGSLYRSENNFGSSSQVPGAASAGAGANAGGGGAGAGNQTTGSGTGGAAAAGSAIPAETAGTGNTSVPASAVLLGAIALLAVAAGVLSRRFRAR